MKRVALLPCGQSLILQQDEVPQEYATKKQTQKGVLLLMDRLCFYPSDDLQDESFVWQSSGLV